MAAGAEPPQPPPAPRCRPWLEEVEPPPGLAHPDSPLGPFEAARRRPAGMPRDRGRETPRGWLRPPKRERAGLVERITERPTSGPCSTDESVVSHPPLPAERHSFLPWALVPFKAPLRPASIRPCRAGGRTASAEPRFDLRGTRAWRLSAANRIGATCNRDPFAGCPPLPRRSAAPGRRRGAEAESDRRTFSAQPRDPRWRVLWPPLGRGRGRVSGRCP